VTAAGEALQDPEVLRFVAEALAHAEGSAEVAESRLAYDRMCAAFRAPRPPGVVVSDTGLAAAEPERTIAVREYRRGDPPAGGGPGGGRAVLYLHGGGYILGGLDSHDDICAEMCAGTGLAVVAVDYRLAPEWVFPAALDDAWAVFRHLLRRGCEVVVAGDSAGGNLAAALCVRARRLGAPQPARQVLIYPQLALDGRSDSYREHAQAPMLSAAACARYLALHAGPGPIAEALLPELAPLAARSFAGLAPAFVVTADIDPQRDDGRDYVTRLEEAGVIAEWRNELQLVHGFLRARHLSRRAAASFAAILEALRAR
jgi:acetyl esterase